MEDKLRNKSSEEVLDQSQSEGEVGPIVPPFHDLEAVTIKVDVAIEVHLMKCLHGNGGPSTVSLLVLGLFEGEVMLDWLSRQFDFVIFAANKSRRDIPEGTENRQIDEKTDDKYNWQADKQLAQEPGD
jgi:hypothetical protein